MDKIFAKIKNIVNITAHFKKVNPHTHWSVLLGIFFVIIIFLIIFSFYLMFQVKNQQIFQITESKEEQPNMINEKLLEKVNESFGNKLIREKEIENGGGSYKDPSIN